MFTSFDKALVAPIVAIALIGLGYFGITGEMSVSEVATLVVTGALTWLVPNKV